MNRKNLMQAIDLFDNNEKWLSFIELCNNKENLKNIYWDKFKNMMIEHFVKADNVEGWSFWAESNKQYRWYLNDFGKDSCYILMTEGRNIFLWANGNSIDLKQIKTHIYLEKFSILSTFLDRIDYFGGDGQWEIYKESGNFFFDTEYDGNYTSDDTLSWIAGNHTAEFVYQIAQKVNKIRKNPEMSSLLRELNEIAKK